MNHRLPLFLLLALCVLPAQAGSLLREQMFSSYSALAAKDVLVPRVLVPTLVDRLQRFERDSGQRAAEHTVSLSEEHFDLFVPDQRPAAGYGLLVFISPMPDFPLSADWQRELNLRGLIFVSARRSGNQQNVLDRRIPLALHAHEHVRLNYPLDPQRVYIGGFSGGSRVAWRMARAYADVFSGALLIGGSDAFGEPDTAPPLRAQMQALRSRSRIVFATGGSDLTNRAKDQRTRDSLQTFCVPGALTVWVPRVDHWVPPRRKFAEALDALDTPLEPTADQFADQARCEARLDAEVDAGLAAVQALLDAGDAAAAGEQLGALEDRYGGLAAPRSIDLAQRIAARLQTAP